MHAFFLFDDTSAMLTLIANLVLNIMFRLYEDCKYCFNVLQAVVQSFSDRCHKFARKLRKTSRKRKIKIAKLFFLARRF